MKINYRAALISSATNPTIKNYESWWSNHKNKFLTNYKCNINIIPLHKMRNWNCENSSIIHNSGRFFSINPYRFERKLSTDQFYISSWDQPLIDQPEIGFLGFLTFIEEGTLKFIVQSKIEPGNEGFIQLSPTIQATKSNFERVHGGNPPDFLRFFKSTSKNEVVLYDQIQSEQGSRFFRKRNRNMIVCCTNFNKNEIDYERFIVMNLYDIKKLMGIDNVINMDTRTVLSNLISLLC